MSITFLLPLRELAPYIPPAIVGHTIIIHLLEQFNYACIYYTISIFTTQTIVYYSQAHKTFNLIPRQCKTLELAKPLKCFHLMIG